MVMIMMIRHEQPENASLDRFQKAAALESWS